jgi:hypothetical protein
VKISRGSLIISPEVTFAFNLIREEVYEKHNEHQEEKGLGANQEFTHRCYWIVIAKSNCHRGYEREIDRIKPMRKRFIEIVSSRVKQSECENNFKIIDQQQQHRPSVRPWL